MTNLLIVILIFLVFMVYYRIEKTHNLLWDYLHKKGDFDPERETEDDQEFERVSKKFGWDKRK